MYMPKLQINVQNDYHLYLYKFVNIDFHVQYNIYFHVSELSFSKSMSLSSHPSDELVGICEVLLSSSMPTNAFSSSSPHHGYESCVGFVSRTIFGIFSSFSILILLFSMRFCCRL